ncbi:hypothetical protein H0H93_003155 [Arthromyces matolae]|nr:hypothetical protein H0H93_003155 [Arthromyces matolae]
MAQAASSTDLDLEHFRLNGMLLGAVSYGETRILYILSLSINTMDQCVVGLYLGLTLHATILLCRKLRRSSTLVRWLLLYVVTTFILATIGFAGNAKYTQTIWIDERNASGGPPVLILTELNFWINRMALACYYIMEWFMSALLSRSKQNELLIERSVNKLSAKDFYDINVQIAYLSLNVGTNILFTLLVVFRLLLAHRAENNLGEGHSTPYISAIAMIVESSSMYSVLGVLYIASFATHSNLSNLIFLDISHVQGIAQLLIIIRVAQGRAYEDTTIKGRGTSSKLPRALDNVEEDYKSDA